MRVFSGLIAVILLVVGVLGMGFGVWAIVKASSMPGADQAMGMVGALTVGGIPFIAGTVALAGAGAIFATLSASEETLTELRAIHRMTAESNTRDMQRVIAQQQRGA